jgi:glycosyltransferase involved in cell wall biosynthesis
MSIFVSHPGLQHSHQLALALYERGLLQAFWSVVPVKNNGERLPFWMPKSYLQKIKLVEIPTELRKHPIIFYALLRAGSALPSQFFGDDYAHRVFHSYDWWVSQYIKKLKPRMVVAYENAAYHTFQAAKAVGARCVLDAASLHHSEGARQNIDQPTLYREEINRRKDEEVLLADLILTCSPMAAESYRKAGVAEGKLKPILLGSDLPQISSIWQPHKQPLRFIFAGALSYRKSIDVILTVFRQLYSEKLPAQVVFVGGMAESKWLNEIRQTPNARYHPGVGQTQLFELMAGADCLLLPSRFDSFGMVVAEAMACGTPAIVSSQTGAKVMIEQFPHAGWIIEPDAESLYCCLSERLEKRDELFAARKHANEAARHFTWQAYRQRAGQVLEEFLGQ